MACDKQSSGLADVNGSDEPTIKAELPAPGPSAPATDPVSLGLGAPAVARAELEATRAELEAMYLLGFVFMMFSVFSVKHVYKLCFR